MELLISATVPNFDAPITIPRYDYKICSAFTSVKSTSGDLIKNLCYVNQGKNFADAQNFCSTNQMKLAIMGDSTVQSAILSAFKSQIQWVFSEFFWVNGTVVAGSCSVVTNEGQPTARDFKIAPKPCGNGHHFFCEY
jgi:hypothetical protein